MSDDFGSALMAADAGVPNSRKTRGRAIEGNSAGSKSVIPGSGKRKKGAPSKSSSPKASRVAAVEQSARDLGFSSTVSKRVSVSSKRDSTLQVYQQRWNVFAEWCKERNIQPLACPIPKVADFLLHLHEVRKVAPSTIANYKSAIATMWQRAECVISIENNRVIRDLMKSFFIAKQFF